MKLRRIKKRKLTLTETKKVSVGRKVTSKQLRRLQKITLTDWSAMFGQKCTRASAVSGLNQFTD
jgi:hypothetical protein